MPESNTIDFGTIQINCIIITSLSGVTSRMQLGLCPRTLVTKYVSQCLRRLLPGATVERWCHVTPLHLWLEKCHYNLLNIHAMSYLWCTVTNCI